MDIEHENGRMNQPCDEWTYDIWMEKEEGRNSDYQE